MSSISGKKVSRISGEVSLYESLMVSEDSSSYSGPGTFHTQRTTDVVPFYLFTLKQENDFFQFSRTFLEVR